MPVHEFGPVYDENSEILILGSFPSVKSREAKFYYMHPQNRFWKLLSKIFDEDISTIEKKKEMLLKHHVALWDVVKECDITGSSDSSLNCHEINDIEGLIYKTKIKKIFLNGRKAESLYKKLYKGKLIDERNIELIYLPSSSPANAAWSFNKLYDEWRKINEKDS